VCKVNFSTMFREPLWIPKRRRKIYLTHRAKFPKTKNQYPIHGESLISRSTLDTYYLLMMTKFFVLSILPMTTSLQADIKRIQAWCAANCMKLNVSKSRVITFSRKTNGLYYLYKIHDSCITRNDTAKNLPVQFDSKLHFHAHVDYIFSQSFRSLALIRTLTYSFSILNCLLLLYLTLVKRKLECASVV
jgi:hypothetical protein